MDTSWGGALCDDTKNGCEGDYLMDGAVELHQKYTAHFSKGLERGQRKLFLHYRFSLLHRRFVFRKVEERDW